MPQISVQNARFIIYTIQYGMIVCAAVMMGVAVVYLRYLIIPMSFAFLVSFTLAPIVDALTLCPSSCGKPRTCLRCRCPLWLAVLFAYCIGTAGLAGGLWIIWQGIEEFIDKSGKYSASVADWSESLFGAAASNTTVSSEETESEPTFTDAILNGTVTFVSDVFLIVLFALYLIAQRSPRACAHRKAQGDRKSGNVRGKMEQVIQEYLSIKFLVSLATGTTIGGLLHLLGVDFALVLGLMAFCLKFIPYFGAVISTLLPLPVVILDPDLDNTVLVLSFLLPVAAQLTWDWGRSKLATQDVKISPLCIMTSIFACGGLLGVSGAFIAVPLLSIVKTALQSSSHPSSQFWTHLIEGSWDQLDNSHDEQERAKLRHDHMERRASQLGGEAGIMQSVQRRVSHSAGSSSPPNVGGTTRRRSTNLGPVSQAPAVEISTALKG